MHYIFIYTNIYIKVPKIFSSSFFTKHEFEYFFIINTNYRSRNNESYDERKHYYRMHSTTAVCSDLKKQKT